MSYQKVYNQALGDRSMTQRLKAEEIQARNSRFRRQEDRFKMRKEIMESLKCGEYKKNLLDKLIKEN